MDKVKINSGNIGWESAIKIVSNNEMIAELPMG